jgi:uncharacterized membrane protein YeiH
VGLGLFALSGAQIAEEDGWAFIGGILSVVVLRLLAIALHWQLPVLAMVAHNTKM